jgi:hypothetical protein
MAVVLMLISCSEAIRQRMIVAEKRSMARPFISFTFVPPLFIDV